VRRRLDLAGGELLRNLARQLLRLALLIGAENGVDRGKDVAPCVQLDVDRLELGARDIRIIRNADVHHDLPAVRQRRDLLDSPSSEAHGGADSTVRCYGDAARVPAERERVVHFRPRTVLLVVGILVASFVALKILWISRHVLSWIFIAVFLTLALNPAVDRLEARLGGRRGAATGVVSIATVIALALIGWLFVPTLVDQVNNFAHKVPDYLDDVTKGRGRLGFLQEKYHLVDKARKALREGGASKLFGVSGTALAIAKGVVTAVVATLTIAFMTFFMLLEGPRWLDRCYSLLAPASRRRWEAVGRDIYRTVGGYVTGNLLISLIAGTLTAIVLAIMGVPYAIALGLIVAILDLIPLAGATIAAIIVGAVAFLHSIPAGIVVVAFFIVYQQIENHVLQPVVYGRTVQLSPLAVLISVLIGAELAGVLGALAAIPVAGAIQVILLDWLRNRRREPVPETG
jgi:predicted PurR-regulated permease PerM